MGKLRSFSIGILYFLGLPIVLAGCLIAGIIGFFNFLVQLVIMLKNFFKGEKLFPPYQEDIEAVKLLEARYQKKVGAPVEQPKPTYVQQNFYGIPNPNMNINPTFTQIPNPQPIENPVNDTFGGDDNE